MNNEQRFSGEWKKTSMGRIGSIYGGLSGKSKTDFDGGNARYVTFLGVLENVVVDVTHTEQVHVRQGESQNLVRKDDLLFNASSETPGDLAIGAVVGQQLDKLFLNSFCFGFRIHNKNEYVPLFLAYFFRGNVGRDIMNALAQGATRYNLSKNQFRDLELSIPSEEEQRAIVEVLSDVDGLINALDALIAKKRAIKQATMQQLLTDKTRLPGFSGAWETKRVSDFGDVITGATPSTKVNAFWDGTFPWITPTDITSERDMTTSERMITLEGLNAIRTLSPNTVLVTCIASIGKNAILRTIGSCNQQINAVTPNAAHNVEFLYYLFEFNSNYLLANAGITATNIVSKAAFSNLEFEIPPLEEQRAIAAVLSDMDAEISALEQRRDKTLAIKRGMMQQLLTGRVRLLKFDPCPS